MIFPNSWTSKNKKVFELLYKAQFTLSMEGGQFHTKKNAEGLMSTHNRHTSLDDGPVQGNVYPAGPHDLEKYNNIVITCFFRTATIFNNWSNLLHLQVRAQFV